MAAAALKVVGDPSNGGEHDIDVTQPYRASVTINGHADILFHRWNNEAVAEKAAAAEGTAKPAARVVRRHTSRPMPECFTVRYDDFGDYAEGRWAWLLRDVRPLRPCPPARGAQGFFDLPPGWMTEVAR